MQLPGMRYIFHSIVSAVSDIKGPSENLLLTLRYSGYLAGSTYKSLLLEKASVYDWRYTIRYLKTTFFLQFQNIDC